MRDVARLYEAALLFTPLRQAAEEELLPRLGHVGSLLRRRLRGANLGPREVEAAATELHGLGHTWQARIEALRSDPTYLAARRAFAAEDQPALARLIPRLFAGLRLADEAPPILCYPVPLARRRRRPGAPPFLTAKEAVEQIVACRGGIEAVSASASWWDEALPYLSVADDPAVLESPVALALDFRNARPPAVFAAESELTLRVYGRRLLAPFSVALHREAQDEWWEASGSYDAFREELRAHLEAVSIPVLDAARIGEPRR